MTAAMDGPTTADGDVLVADLPLLGPPPETEDGDGGRPPEDLAARARREGFVRRVVDVAVVAACAAFVFLNLHPDQILSSAVPAGGDMGAHVWGPAFLRDHLLPSGRLSGWTPDWYSGFPAYQFYMVVPSLLIVVLDVGFFGGWTMALPLSLAGAAVVQSRRLPAGWRRWTLVAGAAAAAVLGTELPYGTAFKLVTVLGVLTLPAAAYAFGRLTEMPFPGPAVMAAATVAFLFDRNFTIYGGNIASTLAGEFAFSISLSLAVVYLGVVVRGLRTGRHRAIAAVLLALTGLCHLIPAFFAIAGTGVIAGAPLARDAGRAIVGTARAAWAQQGRARVVAIARSEVTVVRRFWRGSATARWLGAVLPVGGLLSAFWVLPFFWQRAYVNDMGWEKIPYASADNGMRSWAKTLFTFDVGNHETYWKYLLPRGSVGLPTDLRWVLALACMGLVLSIAFRVRTGWYLAGFALVMGVAFVLLPDDQRLWNARLLPFYYLSLYLLAAVGLAEVGRTIAVLAARDPDRPGMATPVITAVVALLGVFVVAGLPLRTLPLGQERADGSYSWFGLRNGVDQQSFVSGWARWNYTGYEGKKDYPEYRDLVQTMDQVGRDHGCGRSFWEYDKELNRYGTPMALMLLPHWTDGCIGSQEGLFFEASATTPFHFLNQVELSPAPSAAQRDLPYGSFDIDKGIEHLQLLGVRYYLASSVEAITAARSHPALTELTTSGPWVIFQVADSELVEPVVAQPAVLDGIDPGQDDWLCRNEDDQGRCNGPSIAWFLDSDEWDVPLAANGPPEWQRVDPDDPRPEVRPEPPITVSDIRADNDSIAFTVDQVGTPVLVKASYFPNWRAEGAQGPYRVAPNLMVVVPTREQVELRYGREPVEWFAYLLTALGITLVVLLSRSRRADGVAEVVVEAPAASDDPPQHLRP